jgi:hypothetical protein
MTSDRASANRGGDSPGREPEWPADAAPVLGAVREDIRQTLRIGWIDPALEAAEAFPVFFTAAWSAIRPNVGKSFLLLASGLRAQAVSSIRGATEPPDLRKRFERDLAEGELRRVEECVRAAHLASAKVQIVVHAFYRAVRGDRIPGTGREEGPIRRGIPEWQRWISSQLTTDGDGRTPLRLLARWPNVMAFVRNELGTLSDSNALRGGAIRLRRLLLAGVSSLPHPVQLQWVALKARGFSDDHRARLSDVLRAHDASMATQTLTAAFAWTAFGAPDIGAEG